MIAPPQILPFLTHADARVRELAAKYLTDLADAAPIESADALWHAIDQFGETRTDVGTRQLQRFLLGLEVVPQTDSSVTRTIGLLGSPKLDPDGAIDVKAVIANLPLDLLEKRRDEILPVVDEELKLRLEHRLWLRNAPAEDVWQQFDQLAQMSEAADNFDGPDYSLSSRLIEALCNHTVFAIPLATSVLKDPKDRFWLEIWCVELLGKLRYAPAIDLLVEKLGSEDDDVLRETAGDALGRMDAGAVVPRLETAYPSDDPYHRMSVAESLAKVKHPLAEAALIRLLASEDNRTAISALCCALSDLCTTEGLEQLRQIVIADRFDPHIDDVKQLLVTLATMTGFQPPELETWKTQLSDPACKETQRNSFLSSFGMNQTMINQFRKYLQGQPLDETEETLSAPAPYAPPQLPQPYRREQPKIGRNNPCPCGSGKKFKKCCGA